MSIDANEVKYMAKLCNIPITDSEILVLQSKFADTLKHLEVLSELNVSGVEPTYQVTGLKNVFLDNSTVNTLSQEDALKNASHSEKGLIATKAVFDR